MAGEKTEEPTEKKLEDARKKGEAPKSQDVNAAIGLLGLLVAFAVFAGTSAGHLMRIVSVVLDHGMTVRGNEDMQATAAALVEDGLWALLPFVAASIVLGLIASFGQVGFKISMEAIAPKFDKLNPVSGLKRIFSVRSILEVVKMAVKALALGTVVWITIRDLLPLLVGSVRLEAASLAAAAWSAALKLLAAGLLVFIVIAPLDFGLQRWLFRRDQKMSKQDIKDEYKNSEGDPNVKGQRKQLAYEMAMSAPQKAVPTATVVVTNPTHYAVALRYAPGETPLPIIVAKGMDAQAMRIRGIADEHQIPIVGNPPLARALYKHPLDAPIPEELFEAVAAVLRWVTYLKTLSAPAATNAP
jgi:type III secretion protein U